MASLQVYSSDAGEIDELVETAGEEQLRDVKGYLEDRREALETAPDEGLERYGFAARDRLKKYGFAARYNPVHAAKGVAGSWGGRGIALFGLVEAVGASSGSELMMGAGFVGLGAGSVYWGYRKLKNVKSFADTIPEQEESYERAIETIEAVLED